MSIMLKLLAALSLILSLISPHANGAHGAADAAGQGETAMHHAGPHHSDHAGHADDETDSSLQCCHVIVGSCVVGLAAHDDAGRHIVAQAMDAALRTAAPLPTGRNLSFDPPPPRA